MFKFETIAKVDEVSIQKATNDDGVVVSISIYQVNDEICITPEQFSALIKAVKDGVI